MPRRTLSRAQRNKNWALMAALLALAVIIYAISVMRMSVAP